MKDYLKQFETIGQYENWLNSNNYVEPNVSHTLDNDIVHYQPLLPHDYSQDYLTFEAIEDTTFTFTRNSLQYSIDNGTTWTTLSSNNASPTINAGNKIIWKNTNLKPTSTYGIGTFSATGNFKVYGNIMSLHFGDNFIGQTSLSGKDYAFCDLFNENIKLIDASNLILPAIYLANGCYAGMFRNCSLLTTTPELNSQSLINNCYQGMFQNCISLVTAPELPATTLPSQCYQYMFNGCTSLTTAPELPATTLAYQCYASMFYGCSSLTTAPELPATTLAYQCYSGMFSGCSSLTTAPELPATTLAKSCYYSMFNGCTSLNYIKCLATDLSATDCTIDWVNGVAATGTFVKDTNTTWPKGTSGIPSGWTVQDAA